MDQQILALYTRFFGQAPASVEPIGGSASNRRYLRLFNDQGNSVIGVCSPDPLERRAFCELDASMLSEGLPVPRILTVFGDCYLQEDLGRTSLYDLISKCQKSGAWDDNTVTVLHQVMHDLPQLQFRSLAGFDCAHCCRESKFSAMNIRWDLNYFKYCFLKCTGITIDEIRLQSEFDQIEQKLLSVDEQVKYTPAAKYPVFLYRDFQSRNIMVKNGKPYYIDFQGGYEGPFYYDVASFLWQARAGYSSSLRQSLLNSYRESLCQYVEVSDSDFQRNLELFVFFRLLQVLGAYGFRGVFERKAAFLSPLAQALCMIREVGKEFAYLQEILASIENTPLGKSFVHKGEFGRIEDDKTLTVRISSFSYKQGIPDDFSGNGGGFVFDCRAPHNPGRYDEYKHLTGLDQPVIDFLEGRDLNPEHIPLGTEISMPEYLDHVYSLVDPAVETYLLRGFTNLMVSFGCTGGQHRSVYGAQHLAEHIKAKFPQVKIVLLHREQGIQNIF